MTDLADLGLRFSTPGGDEALRTLDRVEAGAVKTEQATDRMAASQVKAKTATSQMLAEINKAVQSLSDMTGAQTQAALASGRATQAMVDQQTKVLAAIDATIVGVKEFAAGLIEGAMAELKAAEAAGQLATQTRAAGAAADDMTARVAKLRQAYDPLGVKLAEISAQMREADALKRAGAISDTEHAQAISGLAERYRALNTVSQTAAKSSGALRFAMLDLTRQFSDVGVSAAMGMNPLMILIQQGPQIADAFQMASASGIGFKAMLGEIAAAAAPVAAVLGAVASVAVPMGVMFAAMAKGAEQSAAFANAMRATGDAAGITGVQFQGMVDRLGHIDGFGKAREALMALAASGKVAGDQIEAVGELSVRLSQLTGEAAGKIAGEWANMGQDVAAFAAKHNDQYHLITEAQYEHIRLLQEEGDTAQAQYELIKAAQATLAQRGEADLGILQRAWKAVADTIGQAWENLKKFGAGGDQGVQNRIDLLNSRIAGLSGGQNNSARQPAIDALVNERDALQAVLDKHHALAQSQAQENQAQQAGIEAARRHAEAYATMGDNIAKVNREIAKYRADQDAIRKANPHSAELDSPARAAQIEADIRKKYTESLRSHARQGPTDQTAQYDALVQSQSAAIDGQIAAAKQTMLQALLKLTDAPEAKAALQAQIDAQGYAKQIADIDGKIADLGKQIATIQAAKLDTHKAAQVAALEGLQAELGQAKVAAQASQVLKDIDANRQALLASTQQQVQQQNAQLQGQEIQLQGQADLTTSTYARNEIEQQILQLKRQELDNQQKSLDALYAAQQAAQKELDAYAATVAAMNDPKLKAAAQAQLEAMQKSVDAMVDPKAVAIQQQMLDNQKAAIDTQAQVNTKNLNLAYGLEEANSSIRSFSDAIKHHDWFGAFNSLLQTLDTVEALMNRFGATAGGSSGGIGGLFGRIFGLGGGSGVSFDTASMARGFNFLGGSGSDSFSGSIEGLSFSMDSLSRGLSKAVGGASASGGLLGGLSGFALPAAMAASLIGGKTGNALGTGLMTGLGVSALGGGLSTVGGLLSWGAAGTTGATAGLGGMLSSAGALLSNPVTAVIAGLAAGLAALGVFGGKPSNFTASATFDANGGVTLGGDKPNDNTLKMIQQVATSVQSGEQLLTAAGIKLNTTISEIAVGQRDSSKIHLSDGRTLTSSAGDPVAAVEAGLKAVLQGATYINDAEKQLVDSMIAAGKGFDEIAATLQKYAAAQQAVTDVANALLQEVNPQAYDIQALRASIAAQRQAAEDAYSAGYITADQLTTVNDQLNQLANLKLQDIFKQYANDTSNASSALKKFRDSLDTGANALLSPEAAYLAAKQAFTDTSSKALGGDAQAQANLQSVSQALLDASKTYFASSGGYFSDLNAVKAAVDQVLAMPGAATSDPSIEIAKQQAGLLGDIDKSLVDIKALLAGGSSSTASAATAASGTSGASGYSYTDPTTGQTYTIDLSQIPGATGFATTGSFTVGGSGGADSQFVPLKLTPGEVVDVRRPFQPSNDNADVVAAIQALRAENVALRQQIAKLGEAIVSSDQRSTGQIVQALDSGKTQRLAGGAG